MGRRRLDDRTWMINHLGPLMEVGTEIDERDVKLPAKVPTYDKGYWTGLKLIALKYYVKPYLNILGPRKRLAYIDLLAGPGLNRLGDREVPVPGSPPDSDNASRKQVRLCEICICRTERRVLQCACRTD